jgi:hypothetical protein
MHNVSPSQIATANQCLRRWWWQSVKGHKAPDTPATLFGGAVHAAIEYRIHNNRWNPDEDGEVLRRAMPAYEALTQFVHAHPRGAVGDLVEEGWAIASDADYPLPSRGRIDLVMPSLNIVADWKTTSSMRYVKTANELARDPQIILYSDALVRDKKLKLPLRFFHVYTLTKGKPGTQVVVTQVTEESLKIGRKHVAATMQRMVDVLAMPDPKPEDVPENRLACGDFGGCPHWDRCFSGGMQLEPEEENVNLTDKLNARKAAQKPAVTQPVIEDLPTEPIKTVVPAGCTPREQATKPGKTLCIGALPYGSREEWVHAEDWLRQFADQACDALKISHWAYAEFGKGKTAIIALVDAAARSGKVPENLVLDRRNILSDAVAEVLLPYYRDVYVKMG